MQSITLKIVAIGALMGLGSCNNFEWGEGNWSNSSSQAAGQESGTTEASAPRSSTRSSSSAGASAATSAPAAGMFTSQVALPTGDLNTSALLVEKILPRQAHLGKPFSYETRVTNLTDIMLDNVVVTETTDANFELTSSEPRFDSTGAQGTQWRLGSMAPNSTRSITVTGTPKSLNTFKNCVSVAYSSALCTAVPVVSPQLKLVASGPAEALQCDVVEYTYVVSNPGSGSALDVVVNANLPNGLLVNGKSSFSQRVGTLAAGESTQFKVRAEASRTGRFQHIAKASAAGDLRASANGIATTIKKPRLEIELSGPDSRVAGRSAAYEITIKNVGDGVARNTALEAMLPSGTSVKSASSGSTAGTGKLSWTIGDLPAGKGIKYQFELGTSGIGTITSSASVKAYCAEEVSTSMSTKLIGIPAVLLEVVDVEDPIEVGANETYVVTVTNQGTAPATNVKIGILLPQFVTFVGMSGSTKAVGPTGASRSLQLLPVASLAPKAKAEWRIEVKSNRANDARFKVTMTSDQLTRPVEESEATTFYD